MDATIASGAAGEAAGEAAGDRARRLGVLVGVGLTLGLLALHWTYMTHAGALWRDEVNSVNVARLPTLADVLAHAHLDSFPLAWVTLLHAWIAAGLGDGDPGLRRLGLAIGVATLAVVWWTGRRLGVAAPLVTLLLLGMSPSAIVYGDQVRGYGLGVLTIVWSFGATWAFVARPSAGRLLVAQLAALLAVQAYYANAFLLLAISAGGAAVAVARRGWGRLLALGAVGAVAALSLLLDLEAMRYAARVAAIELENPGLAWRVEVFRHALAPGVPVLSAAWAAAAVLAATGCVLAWGAARGAPDAAADARPLFAAVTALAALAGFAAYLQIVARVPTQFWYYLSLMAVLALACEVGVDALARRVPRGAWMCLAAVAALALAAAPGVARNVPLRMTNVDLLAATVARAARPDDLVVVLPWYCGITFARYYRGPAPWMTLPDFADHRFHVHELVKERMALGGDGIAAELARVERVLRAGARVWVVGTLLPPPAAGPPPLAAAPAGPEGWHVGPYLEAWSMHLGALLEDHAARVGRIDVAAPTPLNRWEHLPLFAAEGWE